MQNPKSLSLPLNAFEIEKPILAEKIKSRNYFTPAASVS